MNASNPAATWTEFASETPPVPPNPRAMGLPGDGDWGVRPVVFLQGGNDEKGHAQNRTVGRIIGIEWYELDTPDDPTQLFDNPDDLGGGKGIFIDEVIYAGPNHTQSIQVVVHVSRMELVGKARVMLKWFDPDDPSASTLPIDNDTPMGSLSDNRSTSADGKSTGLYSTVNAPGEDKRSMPINLAFDGQPIAISSMRLSESAGDNFRIGARLFPASAGLSNLPSNIRAIRKTLNPDTRGRLFQDKNGNSVLNAGEPLIDETMSLLVPKLPDIVFTPLLTVWRRLNVELDSMGNSGVVGTPDDSAMEVEDPDISMLAEALRRAYIAPRVLDFFSNTNAEFKQNFANGADMVVYANELNSDAGLSLPKRDLYWKVHLIGAYEGPLDNPGSPTDNVTIDENDNDDDSELALIGMFVSGGSESGFIFNEVIRDVAAEHSWTAEQIAKIKQMAVIHLVGQMFDLVERTQATPTTVMATYTGLDDAASREAYYIIIPLFLDDSEIDRLRRNIDSP